MTTKYLFPFLKDSDKAYPLYVVTVGAEHQLLVNRPNGISHHQLLFTISGHGEILLNNKKSEIPHNSIMYLKPNTPQYYYPLCDDWKVMWITYVQNRTFDMLTLDSGIYKMPTVEPYTNLLSLMLKGTGTLSFSKNASMLLYNLLIELKDHLHDTHYLENRTHMQLAVEYIEHNYSEQIENPYLAELSNMSCEHFCRIFKKSYHMRPLEYVQNLRFQEAKRKLITYPDMSITQISESVGFNSPSYFIKKFKTAEGITPSEFRKLHLTNN